MPDKSGTEGSRHYPRRILLAVAARSPQIVTETLYALTQSAPDMMPTEVHVITTGRGLSYVQNLLGSGEHVGQLKRLCDDYALPYPAFSDQHIHLIQGKEGQVLDDVRTRSDNVHAADYITSVVQQLTADSNSSLVVSMSGGRRTMTFYVGYALSLFGRSQDRLTHVLVEDEYFFQEDFYYPPPRSVWVVRNDGSGFDASQVEVTLADIPFVRLREGLPAELLEGRTTFSGVINTAQQEISPPSVVLLSPPALDFGGLCVQLKPIDLAFYVWFLQRAKYNKPPVRWSDAGLATEFLQVYSLLFGETGDYLRVAEALSHGMSKEYFESRKSRANTCLKKVLGQQVAQRYLIAAYGKRPETRFALNLSPCSITLS